LRTGFVLFPPGFPLPDHIGEREWHTALRDVLIGTREDQLHFAWNENPALDWAFDWAFDWVVW